MKMTLKNRRAVTIPRSQLPGILCFLRIRRAKPGRPIHLKLRLQTDEGEETIIRLLDVLAGSPIWGSTHKEQPRRIFAAQSPLPEPPADPPSDIHPLHYISKATAMESRLCFEQKR
jgi:hypothetical protein